MAAAMRYNLAGLMLHDPARIDALALEIHTRSCLATRFRSSDLSRSGMLGGALNRYAGPTLLIWGGCDVTADAPAAIKALTQDSPQRRGLIVPEAGHWVQYERAAQVDEALDTWFVPCSQAAL